MSNAPPFVIPKPTARSSLRLALGKAWFVAKRLLHWWLSSTPYAVARSAVNLPKSHLHASHATPLLRALPNVDMHLQHNKVASLKIAAACIDGVVVRPGEVFSFWRLVGKPTARRGFKAGMVLRNGKVASGMGGGLCQMTNLIYWMTIHTDLTITERWRHGFDAFPDVSRTQPFASGATCSYNYIDLQITNTTPHTYQLRLNVDDTHLHGAWLADTAADFSFEVVERNHVMQAQWWGGYSRHNTLVRLRRRADTGELLGEEFVAENHAVMMYAPLLAAENNRI
jgi:vancomycin resistance protein VanW